MTDNLIDRECIFCSIRSATIKADILFQNDLCYVIRDINPQAPVHLLVVPATHEVQCNDPVGWKTELVTELIRVAQIMAVRNGISETGYRLVINQGSDSGQQIDHLHLHVLGGGRLKAIG